MEKSVDDSREIGTMDDARIGRLGNSIRDLLA